MLKFMRVICLLTNTRTIGVKNYPSLESRNLRVMNLITVAIKNTKRPSYGIYMNTNV